MNLLTSTQMDIFWIIFLLLIGACVGSFLNVLIYRLPRDQSIVFPGSRCASCGRAIRWYDNIPLLSWLLLGGKCRWCKAPISPRYIIIEAVTAVSVAGLYVWYFPLEMREYGATTKILGGAGGFIDNWPMFVAHAALLCGLLVCAAVDIELWIVPLEVTWVVSVIGVASAAYAPHPFMPPVSASTAAVSLAALAGLGLALLLMYLGFIQPSFMDATDKPPPERLAALLKDEKSGNKAPRSVAITAEHGVRPRVEVLRELLFLAPVIGLAIAAWAVLEYIPSVRQAWNSLLDGNEYPILAPHLSGAAAAIFGYLIGGLLIWGTRILGTLAFGKEAMGMGDVHILAAVGAVTGWIVPSFAFFVAPILGLLWAVYLWLRRNQKELPYGPWLAVASFLVMLFYDFFAAFLDNYFNVLGLATR